MATTKTRLNITMEDDAVLALRRLSKRLNKSVSSVGKSLIEKALELEEDAYFSKESDERLLKKEKRIPHHKAWE